MLLTPLHWDRPIRVITSVDLQTLLVGVDVHLNARRIRPQGQHAQVTGFGARVPWSVQDECIVVARAIIPAAIDGRSDITANLLGRGEIKVGCTVIVPIDATDAAGRDLDVVDLDVASCVRHVQRVI